MHSSARKESHFAASPFQVRIIGCEKWMQFHWPIKIWVWTYEHLCVQVESFCHGGVYKCLPTYLMVHQDFPKILRNSQYLESSATINWDLITHSALGSLGRDNMLTVDSNLYFTLLLHIGDFVATNIPNIWLAVNLRVTWLPLSLSFLPFFLSLSLSLFLTCFVFLF